MAERTCRKKKVVSFFGVIFYVYTNVDNGEKLERVIENSLEQKYGNSKRR